MLRHHSAQEFRAGSAVLVRRGAISRGHGLVAPVVRLRYTGVMVVAAMMVPMRTSLGVPPGCRNGEGQNQEPRQSGCRRCTHHTPSPINAARHFGQGIRHECGTGRGGSGVVASRS